MQIKKTLNPTVVCPYPRGWGGGDVGSSCFSIQTPLRPLKYLFKKNQISETSGKNVNTKNVFSVSKQYCGSRSARIHLILHDPDPNTKHSL
jgi:hypothetical protein